MAVMTWRIAESLRTLRDEVDAAASDRSTVSDGTIGDTAHASRTSDHNPNPAGVVRAMDLTHDPAGGLDCRILGESLAALLGRHPALGPGAYIIFARRIISTNRLDEGWRTYTGTNPHDKHLHLSVATEAAGYDSTAPWGVMGDDMLTDEDVQRIADATARRMLFELGIPDPDLGKNRSVKGVLVELQRDVNTIKARTAAAGGTTTAAADNDALVAALQAALAELQA